MRRVFNLKRNTFSMERVNHMSLFTSENCLSLRRKVACHIDESYRFVPITNQYDNVGTFGVYLS